MTQYGEGHYAAKLTEDKVRAMRIMHERGWKVSDLALLFSVYIRTALMAVHRIIWRRVE